MERLKKYGGFGQLGDRVGASVWLQTEWDYTVQEEYRQIWTMKKTTTYLQIPHVYAYETPEGKIGWYTCYQQVATETIEKVADSETGLGLPLYRIKLGNTVIANGFTNEGQLKNALNKIVAGCLASYFEGMFADFRKDHKDLKLHNGGTMILARGGLWGRGRSRLIERSHATDCDVHVAMNTSSRKSRPRDRRAGKPAWCRNSS